MDLVVKVQKPSACFSMSAFSPLQKLTLTLAASGALNRIRTLELPSTCGYCASRTFDEAGLKSPGAWARPRLALNNNMIPIFSILYLRTHLQAEKFRLRSSLPV